MTISGWVGYILLCACIAICIVFIYIMSDSFAIKVSISICGTVCALILLLVLLWYYNNTADGRRALTTERSNLSNGLERVVTVYTATGEVMAKFEGKIDIEANAGGYVMFDFQGKRYMYYNCFVESIGQIP